MDTDTAKNRDAAAESDVVGTFDRSGSPARYVISDTESDTAWLSITEAEVPSLREWR